MNMEFFANFNGTLYEEGDIPEWFEVPKQVAFMESEDYVDEPRWIGGIAVSDYIICGECGSKVSFDNIAFLYVFEDWESISENIAGC